MRKLWVVTDVNYIVEWRGPRNDDQIMLRSRRNNIGPVSKWRPGPAGPGRLGGVILLIVMINLKLSSIIH